jgi:hypothetical protein
MPAILRSLPADYLSSSGSYPLTSENARFDLLIWRGHLWGGRFQTAVLVQHDCGPATEGLPGSANWEALAGRLMFGRGDRLISF